LISLCIIPSGEFQVYMCISQCQKLVLLPIRIFYVAKFTNLTPLSVLILCKLLFCMVNLKMSSCPTLPLKPPGRFLMWCLQNWSNMHSNSS
jgi:hypothetical protein